MNLCLKKLSKQIFILFFLLLVIMIIVLGGKVNLLNSKLAEHVEAIEILSDRVAMQARYGGFNKLPDDLKVTDKDGKQRYLSDIIKGITIILYVDKHQCFSCVTEEMHEFNKVKGSKLKDIPVLIFVGNFSPRELKAFMQDIDEMDTYIVDVVNSTFFAKNARVGQPYLFLLDDKLEVSHILFTSESTRKYVNDKYYDHIFSYIRKL